MPKPPYVLDPHLRAWVCINSHIEAFVCSGYDTMRNAICDHLNRKRLEIPFNFHCSVLLIGKGQRTEFDPFLLHDPQPNWLTSAGSLHFEHDPDRYRELTGM